MVNEEGSGVTAFGSERQLCIHVCDTIDLQYRQGTNQKVTLYLLSSCLTFDLMGVMK